VATLTDVLVPDIGDFTDVPVVEILVAAGDRIAKDDPMITLESDKATMEIPAPRAGVVKELKVKLDDKIAEGAVILTLEVDDDDDDAGAAESPEPPAVAPADDAPAQPPEPAADAPAPAADTGPEQPAHASPVARRMARDLGVDIASVAGSGRLGRVTKDDVLASAELGPAGTASRSEAGERVALTRIQQKAAANLTTAWQTIPHVTHHEDADITDLEAFRKQLNTEQSDVKVTMVALLLRACAAALDSYPRFASSLEGDELVLKRERHLGFAADTPRGLVVPVIRDVDRKGLLQLAGELTELSATARAGKLSPTEMSGAVFTISSLGGIGGTGFTPIVNPPQVAILGVVRSATRPVWDGATFTPRLILPLSLSYDHRVIDGALAARFCAHLAAVLSDLRRILL
jgi:pyruvate dehydrogenase E2 component (dihydrolipoamide acetyltransferase)